MEAFAKAMVKVISILQTARYKTYANLADEAVVDMAQLYGLILSEDDKINLDIIQRTAMRYVRGDVTVWSKGAFIPASKEFPSPAEFRDACLQTWHMIYRIDAIGEKDEDGAKVLITRVTRRDDPQPGVLALDPPATPDQLVAIRKRLERLPAMPSLSEAVSAPRPPREVNVEAEAELERIRQSLNGID